MFGVQLGSATAELSNKTLVCNNTVVHLVLVPIRGSSKASNTGNEDDALEGLECLPPAQGIELRLHLNCLAGLLAHYILVGDGILEVRHSEELSMCGELWVPAADVL